MRRFIIVLLLVSLLFSSIPAQSIGMKSTQQILNSLYDSNKILSVQQILNEVYDAGVLGNTTNTQIVMSGQSIQSAIAAAVTAGCSTNKPMCVEIMPGSYNITSTIVVPSGMTIHGHGCILNQDAAVPVMRIADDGNQINIHDIRFNQALPSTGYTYPVVCVGPDYAVDPEIGNVQNVNFYNCIIMGYLGPQIIGCGHEVHWYDGGSWLAYADYVGDVCLTDGMEDTVNGKNWVKAGVPNITASTATGYRGKNAILFNYTFNSSYNKSDIAYCNLPYASGTVTSGARCDTIALWMKITATINAGDYQLLIKSGVNGGGDTVATVDLPAFASNANHFIHALDGVAGKTIGSIVLHQVEPSITNGTVVYIALDDAWLQSGVWGLHENIIFKTLMSGGGSTGAWMSFRNAVLESRNYISSSVNAAGHTFGLVNVEDQNYWTGIDATPTIGMVCFDGCKILCRPNGTPAVGNAPQISETAVSGAGGIIIINNSHIVNDHASSITNMMVYPAEMVRNADASSSGTVTIRNCYLSTTATTAANYSINVGSFPYWIGYGNYDTKSFFTDAVNAGATHNWFSIIDGAGYQLPQWWRIKKLRVSGTADQAGTLTLTVYVDGVAQSSTLVLTATGSGSFNNTSADSVFFTIPPNADVAFSVTAATANWSDAAVEIIKNDLTN